jgi:hypothetical protein
MSDYFDRIERQLVRRAEAGSPRRSWTRVRLGLVVPALSAVVVAAIAVVFLSAHGASSPSGAGGGVELVYQAEPTPQTPVVSTAALARTIDLMRARAGALGLSAASFRASTSNEIAVRLPRASNYRAPAVQELGRAGQLAFFDWEATAITPNGKTVASQLRTQDPTATDISQGTGSLAPGEPGAGSLGLYQAVRLASKQPQQPFSSSLSHIGPLYYVFGAPGSAACTTAAHDQGTTPVATTHCLLSGPDTNTLDLISGLPRGVSASEGQVLTVPQGWLVMQAANLSASDQVQPDAPAAQFYVLRDAIGLRGSDITNPQPSTDATGAPNVTFGFTTVGAKAFEDLTGTIAHRGATVSTLGQTLDQHFAVALDSQLITVPQIDFSQYPDGISAAHGADISGGLTSASARYLATEVRLGALPVSLRLVLAERLSNPR